MRRKKIDDIQSNTAPLRLYNVKENLYNPLNNISDNLGIEFPKFMIQELRKIEESFPPTFKAKSKVSSNIKKEIRLRNVSKVLIENLENIAENCGLDFDSFLKQQLSKRIETYTPEQRKPIILFPSERGRRS